jgi:hypothetical protein
MRLALAVIALLQRRVEDVPPFLSVAQKWVMEMEDEPSLVPLVYYLLLLVVSVLSLFVCG